MHDEEAAVEAAKHRAFDVNALEATVYDMSRAGLLVAVGHKQSLALEAVGGRGLWRMDKCSPQTTVERQLKAGRPPDARVTCARGRPASVVRMAECASGCASAAHWRAPARYRRQARSQAARCESHSFADRVRAHGVFDRMLPRLCSGMLLRMRCAAVRRRAICERACGAPPLSGRVLALAAGGAGASQETPLRAACSTAAGSGGA